MLLNKFPKNISPSLLNKNKKKIRLVETINNSNKNSKLTDGDQQRLTLLNFILWNKPLYDLSQNFRHVIFSKSKFLVSILVLNTRYEYFRREISNLIYLFNNQFDFVLAENFTECEIFKHNIDKFLSNLLIKFILKNFYITI